MYFFLKVIISALVIAAASEVAKTHRVLAAVLLSLPLTSLLAIIWIYFDSQDRKQITLLTQDIFWLVLISLVFFIALPLFLRQGLNFWVSLAISGALTMIGYFTYLTAKSLL